MKKTIFLFIIIWLSVTMVLCQNQLKKETGFKLGLSLAPIGRYHVHHFFGADSDPNFYSTSSYSVGISVFFKTKKMVEFESGVYYGFHLLQVVSPNSYYPDYYKDQKISLIECPLNIRIDFPYFYVCSGLLIDFELNDSNKIDNQSGFGFNTGFGISYKFKGGILIYAGPNFYFHNLYPSNGELLTGGALKIGIVFN